jgi:hypothetical protein
MTTDVLSTKEQIDLICRLALNISTEDVAAVLNDINATHTLMPIMDPTGYNKILRTIGGHTDEVRAFLTFRRALDKMLAEVTP